MYTQYRSVVHVSVYTPWVSMWQDKIELKGKIFQHS